MQTVLIAGATGGVGIEAVRAAKAAGWRVRATGRRVERIRDAADEVIAADALVPGALSGICNGASAVISCLGAPLSLTSTDTRSLYEVDTEANRRLLEESLGAGVRRFVYVSMFLGDGYNDTVYVQAHERFVEILRASGMAHTVIRPTGIFWAMADLVGFARKGMIPILGGGVARTNPVHEADVAEACVAGLADDSPSEISIGGPEIFTRRELAEAAFQALGKKPNTLNLPMALFRLIGWAQGINSARKRELFDFFAAVSTSDCVAPQVGTRKLRDYFAARALAQ